MVIAGWDSQNREMSWAVNSTIPSEETETFSHIALRALSHKVRVDLRQHKERARNARKIDRHSEISHNKHFTKDAGKSHFVALWKVTY